MSKEAVFLSLSSSLSFSLSSFTLEESSCSTMNNPIMRPLCEDLRPLANSHVSELGSESCSPIPVFR